ncbi:MAG TPA: TSUP family transporter [Streptosporangiaceae bacterium]|nr:TSUP family transporter [Streptosporangiaceae bacterium]
MPASAARAGAQAHGRRGAAVAPGGCRPPPTRHINWALAGEFAAGQIPGSAAGSQFAHHVQGPVIRRAFGWFLIAFGLLFTIDRIIAH